MAVRFSKRIKIAKGLSLNLSRSGVGVSMGGRGGSISVGKRGVYANTSLPGTGLSYRTKLSGGQQKPASNGSAATPFSGKISIQLHDDGLVTIVDEHGAALPTKLANQVKAENQEAILAMLNRAAEGNNLELEECLTIHQLTPDLRQTPEPPPAFANPKPSQPAERKISFIDKLLMQSNRIRQQNEECRNQHAVEVRAWELEKAEYDRSTLAITDALTHVGKGAVADIETVAEYVLSLITWPKETLVSYEISSDGRTLALDIDLPDEDDVPSRLATVNEKGLKLTFKSRTEAQRRKDFVLMAYGTLFRCAGEMLAALPSVKVCVVSGYLQRLDKTTGKVSEDYVLSAIVDRAKWSDISFDNLESVDPAVALKRFPIRVKVDRTATFEAITPFEITDASPVEVSVN